MKTKANKQSQINRREKRKMNRENKPKRIVIIEEKPKVDITELRPKPKVEMRDASTQVTGQLECTRCRKWVRHLVACHECLYPPQPPPTVPVTFSKTGRGEWSPRKRHYSTVRKTGRDQWSPQKRRYPTPRIESRKMEARAKRQFEVETRRSETSILHNRDIPFTTKHTFHNNRNTPPETRTQPENNDDFDSSRQEDLLPTIE